MIDLRSDTVTSAGDGMRRAMVAADVGDDVYGEDPTVRELEERTADLFGFEAGLLCPTGSLSNVLAVGALVAPGQEVLCESQAHIARAELGAHAAVGGLTMRTWVHPRGLAPPDDVCALASPDLGPFIVATAAVSIENTHNFAGGTVHDQASLLSLRGRLRESGIAVHLDGARVWNAHVATGTPLRELGSGVADTMSVCFSKGLGAPVGSVMLGTAEQVAGARVRRKRLGGGWRQAGHLAAAALYALDHHVERLADDHAHARLLAEAAGVDPATVETNIVMIPSSDPARLAAACAEDGVALSVVGPRSVRAVTHLDVSPDDAATAARVIAAQVSRVG